MIARQPATPIVKPMVSPIAGGIPGGANVIVNGDFSADSDWVKQAGWTISGGVASISVQGAARNLSQLCSLVAGATYLLTYTVSAFASGTVTPQFVGGSVVSGVARSANGTYTETIVAPSGTAFSLRFQAAISTALSIDNVSLTQVAS